LVLISTNPGLPSIPGRPQVVGKMLTPKRFRGGGPRRGPAVRGGHRQARWRGSAAVPGQPGRGSGLGYLYQLAAAAGWSGLPFL